jgi:hypothetical protein
MKLSLKPSKLYQFSLGPLDFKKIFEDIRKDKEPESLPFFDYSKVLTGTRLYHHVNSFLQFNETFLRGNIDIDTVPLTFRANGKNISPIKKTGALSLKTKKSMHINAGRGTLTNNIGIIREKRESHNLDSPQKLPRHDESPLVDSGRSRANSRVSVYKGL